MPQKAANGRVRLVDTALSRQWLEQLQAFPLGAHDDAVDATVAALEYYLIDWGYHSQGEVTELMDKIIRKPRGIQRPPEDSV